MANFRGCKVWLFAVQKMPFCVATGYLLQTEKP